MNTTQTPNHSIDESASVAAYQRGHNDAMLGRRAGTDPRAPIAYAMGYYDASRINPTRNRSH